MTTIYYQRDGNEVGLTLDATLKESTSLEAQPTEHPVEDGTTISDHIIVKPDTYTLEGVFSSAHPFDTSDSRIVDDIVDQIRNGSRPAVQASASDARATWAQAALIAILKSRTVCSISTARGRYDSLMMTKLTINREAKSSGAVDFSATFRSFVTATSQRVDVQLPPARPPPGEKKESGEKATSSIDTSGSFLYTVGQVAGAVKPAPVAP